MYPNVKLCGTVCRSSYSPTSTSKDELHPKKVLLSVWWGVQGIIHFEVLLLNQTINAAFYYLQLDNLHSNLVAKPPSLINLRGVILQRDNAKPHAAVITRQKLLGLGWKVFPQPPYSPYFAPTDYRLFHALNNSCNRKIFDDLDSVKTTKLFLLETTGILPPWDSSPTGKMGRGHR